MYGALFNYKGYNLDIIENNIENSCVPTYLLKTHNNQGETKKENIIIRLTMNKLLEVLNMKNIDEGCSIEQVSMFCTKYKITYYVLDFKYKLFETSSNNNNNYHLKHWFL